MSSISKESKSSSPEVRRRTSFGATSYSSTASFSKANTSSYKAGIIPGYSSVPIPILTGTHSDENAKSNPSFRHLLLKKEAEKSEFVDAKSPQNLSGKCSCLPVLSSNSNTYYNQSRHNAIFNILHDIKMQNNSQHNRNKKRQIIIKFFIALIITCLAIEVFIANSIAFSDAQGSEHSVSSLKGISSAKSLSASLRKKKVTTANEVQDTRNMNNKLAQNISRIRINHRDTNIKNFNNTKDKSQKQATRKKKIQQQHNQVSGFRHNPHEHELTTTYNGLYNFSSKENNRVQLETLDQDDPQDAAGKIVDWIGTDLGERIAYLFDNTKTASCRAKVAQAFAYHVNGIGLESNLPFTDINIQGQKGLLSSSDSKWGIYNQPLEEAEFINHPNDLNFLFGILTHDDPDATIRLINCLHEEGHNFVIHVDKKEGSHQTYKSLFEFASTRNYVHILRENRVSITRGGFSEVQAILNMLRYALVVDSGEEREPILFHKYVHLSASFYPIVSNREIRHVISDYPLDANLMKINPGPVSPDPKFWHYVVECDDVLHRIHRLSCDFTNLYKSSPWFIISHEFAEYLAMANPGSFVYEFIEYAEHFVPANELFFGSVLLNSAMSGTFHNDNLFYVAFNRESSAITDRGQKKCPYLDPNHCGKVPTLLTMEELPFLKSSDDLFAGKIDSFGSSAIKDSLDEMRIDK